MGKKPEKCGHGCEALELDELLPALRRRSGPTPKDSAGCLLMVRDTVCYRRLAKSKVSKVGKVDKSKTCWLELNYAEIPLVNCWNVTERSNLSLLVRSIVSEGADLCCVVNIRF